MKTLSVILLTISFFQCKSAKLDQTPPFSIKEATYNRYVGGVRGVSGMWIHLNYETNSVVKFDSIYFQGKRAKIEIQKNNNKKLVSAHFNTSTRDTKNDLILDSNSLKEFNNELPKQKTPFQLEENEAILSYLIKGKAHYYKVKNIKKIKTPLPQ